MPYGLTGATQTCQRSLDTILQHCKYCVDNYVDDCIVFSDNMTTHIQDLRQVLGKLQAAGLTLRAFGTDKITHLGLNTQTLRQKPFQTGQHLPPSKKSAHF